MKTFYVEINFKTGPSFSIQNVPALSKPSAKDKTIQEARSHGFDSPVKKVTVKEQI
jgi:hypothetical protein